MAVIYRHGYPLAKIYWRIFKPVTNGVRCFIINNGNLLLISHTYGSNKRTVPGGGIKSGETPTEAARREVREEVGLELSEITEGGMMLHTREHKTDTIHLFVAKPDSDEIIVDESEIARADWFNLKDLPDDVSGLFEKQFEIVEHKIIELSNE